MWAATDVSVLAGSAGSKIQLETAAAEMVRGEAVPSPTRFAHTCRKAAVHGQSAKV